jgi:hypothetical protein
MLINHVNKQIPAFSLFIGLWKRCKNACGKKAWFVEKTDSSRRRPTK